jgi:hypothetical protein
VGLNPIVRIHEEADYVFLKRYDFSLSRLVERYPDVTPDKVIAQALCIKEEHVEEEYERIVEKLRGLMGV